MNFCTKCGAVVPEGNMFCPNCGNVINQDSPEVLSADTAAVNVREAEVFYDGARLRTSGVLELKKGTNHIWFRGLSPRIEAAAVQLKVSGLVSRFMEPVQATVREDAEAAKTKEQLSREIEVLKLQEDLLKKNGDFTGRQNMTTGEIVQYLQQLPELLRTIDGQIEEKKTALKELQENVKAVKETMIEAEVECPEAGSYPFNLTFVTKDAGWLPFYDIYADEQETIRIQLKARLFQTTDSEWDDCRITLVSGLVNRTGNLPVLRPKYYYGAVPPQEKAMRAGGAMPFGGAMPAAAPMPMMSMMSQAAATVDNTIDTLTDEVPSYLAEIQNGSVVRYVLPDTFHISSGKKGTVLNIHSFQASGSFRYESIPMLDNTAYLVAEIRDFRDLHLMECKANIFLQGNYVGETRIPDVSEDTMVLSLGQDDRIEVTRTEKKADRTSAFLKNTQTNSYVYLLTVFNTGTDSVEVRLYDQVPISRTQEIKVETVNLSGGIQDETDGKVTWNLKIEPGEKKEITLAYNVTWPKDKVLR